MEVSIQSIGMSLKISDELLSSLYNKGKEFYPNEFGGFLIGYFEDDTHLVVTDSILPIKYKSTKFNFERSTEGLEKKFIDKYNEVPKKTYIGEWHTHPDSKAIPSKTDILAMHTIVEEPNSIKNPVLLIIGYNQVGEVEFDFYIYYKNKIYKYE